MSRRKNRFKRRQEKREKQKEKYLKYDDFESIASYQSLYNSAHKASCGVSWKASVQRYLLNILFKIHQTRKNLLNSKDIRKGFIEFDLNERGKVRHIKSVHFSERVVQKSFCVNALYPTMTRFLIQDNCASQKGKGTHYAIDRLTKFLRKHYRKHGNSGFFLTIDFKNYFGNIQHEPLKKLFREHFKDKMILKLADDFVDAFGEIGLGLGSETSQTNAVAFVDKIDHWIKEQARCKYYVRYMDDCIIIHESKEELKKILETLYVKFEELGIVVNKKKTHIADLKHGFTFLKTRFYLTESGKVIRKPCRKSITVERKKLKKQAKLYQQGIMSLEDITRSYQSWRGSMRYRNAKRTVYNMDKLFKELFERGKNDEIK